MLVFSLASEVTRVVTTKRLLVFTWYHLFAVLPSLPYACAVPPAVITGSPVVSLNPASNIMPLVASVGVNVSVEAAQESDASDLKN